MTRPHQSTSPHRRRGRLAAATAGLALAAGVLGHLTAATAGPPRGTPDAVDTYSGLTFTVPAGTNDLGQPQTCTIDADLYRPHSAGPDRRVPAILTTNGFGGSKADQAGLGRAFAQRGYTVLSYTGLGFPDSGCKIALDDPGVDGVAARSLVTFLGGGSSAAYDSADLGGVPAGPGTLTVDFTALDDAATHDPRVGMLGGSYGGQIQFATAAVDDRVDTLVPLITWNDLRYALAPNNTSFTTGTTYADSNPGTEKVGWVSLFFGAGILDGVTGASIDPARNVGCPNFVLEACAAKATLDTLGHPTEDTYRLTDRVSVGHYLDRVKVPTFLIQGQNDTLFNLQEAVATYRGLKQRGIPVSMAWQSWGHSGGANGRSGAAPGELDLTGADIEGTYLGKRIKDWFDHHLKGTTAPTGPEFAYFRDWVAYTGSAAPAYATADSYPVGRRQTWYLSAADELARSRTEVLPGSRSWSNPRRGGLRVVLRGVGTRGAGRRARWRHDALRHPGHLRRLDDPGPAVGDDHRRRAGPRRPVRVTGGCGDPGGRAGRAAAGLRQDVRRRTRRQPDPGAQAHQPDPGRRRHPARARRAPGRGAPRRRGAPHPAGPGQHRRGLQERPCRAAGDRAGQPAGPSCPEHPGRPVAPARQDGRPRVSPR